MASKRRETWGAKENSTMFKNHKKVSFNIASEASYFDTLSGHKLIKNAKKLVHFSEILST